MNRVSWHIANNNPRRAGLRYRCLYPMEELKRRHVAAEIFDAAHEAQYQSVVFDAWSAFPSVASSAVAAGIVPLMRRLKRQGTHLVIDNCDNPFVRTPNEEWYLAQERLREMMRLADTLTSCTPELVELLRTQCTLPERIHIIRDPIEERIRYPDDNLLKAVFSPTRKLSWIRYLEHAWQVGRDRRQGRTPLVWFGNHGNRFAEGGMLDLLQLREMLESLDTVSPISLSVISNHKHKFDAHIRDWTFPTHYLEWDRITFLAALRLHRICLIPSSPTEFSLGKSANRPTLALHHGLNVVCDGVPSYRELSGFVMIDDWERGLSAYLGDPALCAKHLRAANDFIEQRYLLPAVAEEWRKVLFQCA